MISQENDVLVSIITPTFNSSKYITECIDSVSKQTIQNWELLITDDCSTDNTWDIISKYSNQDSRIKVFRLDQNSGAAVARNKSIENAKGRFIAFLDSDDMWFPNKLEKQIEFMKEKKCALSYSSYMTCNNESETTGIIVCRNYETFSSSKKNNNIGCLTAVYDTEKVGKVYMPLLRKRQDWGLMLRILEMCDVAYGIKEPLAIYRHSSNSISSNKSSLIKYNLLLYQEVLGWSFIHAYIYFIIVFIPNYIFKKLKIKMYN